MSAAARAAALAGFGRDGAVDRYEACYRRVLAGHPSGDRV
jgi:hypothetical protein